MPTLDAVWSTTTPQLAMGGPRGPAALAPGLSGKCDVLRERVGEFVGNVFYGTLMKQMQGSKLKGKFLHGGRGEEVFRGQLNMELAKRMGQAASDPVAKKMYAAFSRQANAETPKSRNAETETQTRVAHPIKDGVTNQNAGNSSLVGELLGPEKRLSRSDSRPHD